MTSQDMSQVTGPDPEYVALYRRLRAEGGVELRDQLHARYLEIGRGATTPAGLPYPDPTDPVAEGASAIRALAEALDPGVADTGWVAISLAAGFTGSLVYRRKGDIVEVRSGSAGIAGSFPAGNTTITTALPATATPVARIPRGSAYLSGSYPGVVSAGTGGDIFITNQSGAARTSAAFSIVFFVEPIALAHAVEATDVNT